MKKSQRQIVYERAEKYAKEHLKKINVSMGDYDGGQKCHHVARHRLETGEHEILAIALSFVPKSGVNVHFVNRKNSKQDQYVDNTLGYLSKSDIYYLISEHTLEEIQDDDMVKLLVNIKEKILSKLFTDKEKKELGINSTHI